MPLTAALPATQTQPARIASKLIFSGNTRALRGRQNSFATVRREACTVFATRNVEIKVVADDGMPPLSQVWPVEDGSELYSVSLKKPLGLTLAEQGEKVVVEALAEGDSNGGTAGIQVGDIVRGTTARSKNVRQDTATSVEARNKQSFLGGLVLMRADGEKFDTVLAAIQSSKCSQCDVTLVMERPAQN